MSKNETDSPVQLQPHVRSVGIIKGIAQIGVRGPIAEEYSTGGGGGSGGCGEGPQFGTRSRVKAFRGRIARDDNEQCAVGTEEYTIALPNRTSGTSPSGLNFGTGSEISELGIRNTRHGNEQCKNLIAERRKHGLSKGENKEMIGRREMDAIRKASIVQLEDVIRFQYNVRLDIRQRRGECYDGASRLHLHGSEERFFQIDSIGAHVRDESGGINGSIT